jgi:mevalonate kinase
MNVNQGLLGALGLSSPGIEALVYRLRALGAKGAKLTGAGGDGGAVIGLFERPAPVVARLTREGIRCFSSPLSGSRIP